jgi:probable phosphoglycerate mutase
MGRRVTWMKKPIMEKVPNEVRQRQLTFINYLVEQPVSKALICMHGRAMRIFLPTLIGEPLTRMDQFPHHNLTLYKLIYSDRRFTIDLFNNMDHLNTNGKS